MSKTALRAFVACMLTALIAAVLVGTQAPSSAQALSGSDFQAGNIISDANFYNANAMSQSDIQSFLQSQVSCTSSNCLANYRTDTTSQPADAMCNAYQGASGEPTSAVIYKVQQACGISAKVLIVTLQKEQALITDPAPTTSQLNKAMGYACPDTSACDTTYYGVFNQIYHAAWQLKRYGNPAGTSNFFNWYPVGSASSIAWNPSSACGSSQVTIQNAATAALYYYTPYQPNSAALNNLTGLGDGCSSYGNRNFWVFYNNWFGSPTEDRSPFGGFNLVTGLESITFQGWAIDPDTTNPVRIDVYSDNQGFASFQANASRPDVGAAYPNAGNNHGINATYPISPGTHNICVYAINVGPGGNTLLGCQSTTIKSASPFGAFNIVPGYGSMVLQGWAIDPNTAASLRVDAYVDGNGFASFQANASRPDVGAAYPGAGNNHGINATYPITAGDHSVCLYAINVGAGSNTLLGCQTTTIKSPSPFGDMAASAVPGGASLTGWAIDPDAGTGAVRVDVYDNNQGLASFSANTSRPDVGSQYPAFGANHGFAKTFTMTAGSHSICAYAINVGAGSNTLLGCNTVAVQSGSPFGGTNIVVGPTTVTLNGWAIDPDTANAARVDVYADGKGLASFQANASRPDVGRVYPGYGDNHGIAQTFTFAKGTHQLCVYAINVGPGSNTQLNCYTFTMPTGNPFGGTNISTGPSSVTLQGWVIDPDSTSPVRVDVYSDNVGLSSFTANASRPDVGRVYPGYGDNHGILQTIPITPGIHNICVYGINIGAGGNTLLNCYANVEVPK